MSEWSEDNIPEDLRGKVFVITGTSAGIGTEMARLLGRAGATVIGGNRDNKKAEAALAKSKKENGEEEEQEEQEEEEEENNNNFHSFTLDLCDRESIVQFAEEVKATVQHIDGLILNAGVMGVTGRRQVSYGLESQLATNVAGHHLLTSLLLPLLLASGRSVVVATSSVAAKMAKAHSWRDINSENKYKKWEVYAMTKAMSLQWRSALHQKLEGEGLTNCHVITSHPGASKTALADTSEKSFRGWMARRIRPFFMKPSQGCLSSLRAVLDPSIPDNSFVGPEKQYSGNPMVVEDFQPELTQNKKLIKKTWRYLDKVMEAEWPWSHQN